MNKNFNSRRFKEFINCCIEDNNDELTQKLAKKAIKYDPENFRHLLNYKLKFPNFFLDPKLVIFAIPRYCCNLDYLIKYCIKTGKNELTPEIARKGINSYSYNIFSLFTYRKKFTDFYIDPKLIEFFVIKTFDGFEELVQYFIENDVNELTQDLVKKAINDNSRNFQFLLRYCRKFPDFYLDPIVIKIAMLEDARNFVKLVEFYIKLSRYELTQDIVELAIKIEKTLFFYVLDYRKKFPEFYLDPKFVEFTIFNVFPYLVKYYIKTDRNELDGNLAEKVIKDDPTHLKFLLKYKIKFPDFYLDQTLIEFAAKYSVRFLIKYYIKTDRNELTEKIAEEIIEYDSDNVEYLTHYCNNFPDFYLNPKLIAKCINDNFFNIGFFNHISPEIIKDINFDEVNIEINRYDLKQDVVDNLINNLKIFAKFKEFKNRNETVTRLLNGIFNEIYESCLPLEYMNIIRNAEDEIFEIDQSEEIILHVMPMKKSARNIY